MSDKAPLMTIELRDDEADKSLGLIVITPQAAPIGAFSVPDARGFFGPLITEFRLGSPPDAVRQFLDLVPPEVRLALARALVPGWAVVPREATEVMCNARRLPEIMAAWGPTDGKAAAVWTAMLTAAEEPPHGP